MAGQGDSKWIVSPVDFSGYYTYYHRVTPPGRMLGGSRAREFFLQTKLPPQTLSQIWKLSDQDRDGQLNSAEFAVAMHLVRVVLKDSVPLPTTLPTPLQSLTKQTLYPQLPVANQAHLEKCRNAFGAFFENIGKGVLGGDAARYLMLKSNLPKPQLYHIWRLADIDGDGRLSFLEFTVAMQLIFIAKLGYILPVDLDPNTIIPPSFYQLLQEVQSKSDHAPRVSPTSDPLEPFSPPTTPGHETMPTFFGENPFVSDAFINLPARQFREREFENFTGDPFETMDPFSGDGGHNISVGSDDFVDSTSPPVQNGHGNLTPDNTYTIEDNLIRGPTPSLSQEQAQQSPALSHSQLLQTSQTNSRESLKDRHSQASSKESLDHPASSRGSLKESFSQANSKESLRENYTAHPSHSPAGSRGSLRESYSQGSSKESLKEGNSQASLKQYSQESRSHASSKESLTDSHTSSRHSQNSQSGSSLKDDHTRSPIQSSQESIPSQREGSHESIGRASPKLSGSNHGSLSNLSQQSGSFRHSQESVSSVGSLKVKSDRRSERSSTASFQEVVVEEHVEPSLQLPTAVDVVGSREVTPVPDHGNGTPEVVDLESLSRASRKLVTESQSRLEEQQRANMVYVVPEECKQASIKGLSAAIEDIEIESTSSSHSQEISSSQEESEELEADEVMSQLDDLEAEMLSTIDEADFDFDGLEDEEQIEVGALDLEDPDLHVRYGEDDRKTPVSDAPLVEETPTHVTDEGSTARHLNGVGDIGVSEHVNGVCEEPAVPSVTVSLRQAKEEQRKRKSQYLEAAMDELDNFLEDELADINDMFQEFQTKDKQVEEKRRLDAEHIKSHRLSAEGLTVALPEGDTAEIMERLSKEREAKMEAEGQKMAQEWAKEMQLLEAEGLRQLQERDIQKQVDSDAVVQALDAELQSLIKHEEEAVKIAQKEKELAATREKEEQERRERERKERLMREGPKEEMSIEEWIEWMEEKKKAGMTPEQVEELERRRASWEETKRQREEKRRREEQEKIENTRRKMETELRAIKERDKEIKSNRLTDEELEEKRREKALKDKQEADERRERSKAAKDAMRQHELEEMKPKAKSALAARWEERIRARSEGKMSREENKATVISGTGMNSLKREEERLTKRISNGSRLSTSSNEGLEEGLEQKS